MYVRVKGGQCRARLLAKEGFSTQFSEVMNSKVEITWGLDEWDGRFLPSALARSRVEKRHVSAGRISSSTQHYSVCKFKNYK